MLTKILLHSTIFQVASLPQHAHLFAEVSVVERTLPPWIHHRCNIPHTHPCFDFQHGCFAGKDKNNKKILVDCSDANRAKGEVLTPLPESFKPLVLTDEMDKAWFDLVKNFKTSGRPSKAALAKSNL